MGAGSARPENGETAVMRGGRRWALGSPAPPRLRKGYRSQRESLHFRGEGRDGSGGVEAEQDTRSTISIPESTTDCPGSLRDTGLDSLPTTASFPILLNTWGAPRTSQFCAPFFSTSSARGSP